MSSGEFLHMLVYAQPRILEADRVLVPLTEQIVGSSIGRWPVARIVGGSEVYQSVAVGAQTEPACQCPTGNESLNVSSLLAIPAKERVKESSVTANKGLHRRRACFETRPSS
jgi:hypothetical protein